MQQEKRMNKATEVMMQYVENLKRTYEKDHTELMEFKKLANQNSNRCYGGSVDTGGRTTREGHWASLKLHFTSAEGSMLVFLNFISW